MDDDNGLCDHRECHMAYMTHYAEILETDAAHSEATVHDHLSEVIMADAADFWTGDDARWLETMMELIWSRRQLAAMKRKPRFRLRFRR